MKVGQVKTCPTFLVIISHRAGGTDAVGLWKPHVAAPVGSVLLARLGVLSLTFNGFGLKYPYHMRKPVFFILIIISVLILAAGLFYLHHAGFLRHAAIGIKAHIVKCFPFSQENSLKEWEEKIFKGKVIYKIEKDKTLDYVRARSDKTASALYYKLKMDARRNNPVISWKWNVSKFPEKKEPESLETEKEGDFAARVYVIFPAVFFTNSRVLEYVWTEDLPEGTTGTSPYSNNIKVIVAQSGPNPKNQWFFEERDIVADYVKVFGKKPEYDIGAVAFMTNTDHTGTTADAMYDDIKLGYKEQ